MPTSLNMHPEQASDTSGRLNGRKVFLIFCGFFGVIFAMNALFLHLAFSTFGGIEAAGAYRSNFLLTKEIVAAERQGKLGWKIAGTVDRGADNGARVKLAARDRNDRPVNVDTLKVELRRPANSRLDETVAMQRTGAGTFEGRVANVAPGQWDLVVTLHDKSGERFHSRNRIVLK